MGFIVTLLLVSLATTSQASPVHRHGHADVAVVLEGTHLEVIFTAPLADILGTERAPADDQQRARYAQGLEKIQAPRPSPQANCHATQESRSTVDTLFPPQHADHDHDHDHDHEHGHHVDVRANWQFSCASPQHLDSLDLPWLAAFPNLTTEVILLLPQGQHAVQLRGGRTRVSLR